jgi:hypothetical protein
MTRPSGSDLRKQIVQLTKTMETRFLELGELLEALKEKDPEGYEKVVAKGSGVMSP